MIRSSTNNTMSWRCGSVVKYLFSDIACERSLVIQWFVSSDTDLYNPVLRNQLSISPGVVAALAPWLGSPSKSQTQEFSSSRSETITIQSACGQTLPGANAIEA